MIDHPISRRLQELEAARVTGSLNILGDSQNRQIMLRKGMVDAIRGGNGSDRLGQMLVRNRLLDEKVLGRLLKQVSASRTLGFLVHPKAVSRTKLLRALELQTLHRLHGLLENPELTASNFEESAPIAGLPLGRPFSSLLLQVARNWMTENGKETPRLALHEPLRGELNRWPWRPEELAVLVLLHEAPQTLDEMAETLQRSPHGLAQVLRALRTLGAVRTTSDSTSKVYPPLKLEEMVPVVLPDFSEKLIICNDAHAFVAEQFRSLKVRLAGAADRRLQVLTITSPFIQDGKSLVSANLALACAEDPGRRVLLMDGDFRRGTVHESLGISKEPGVVDYLGDAGLEPFCFMRQAQRLFVMTAGKSTPQPVEALSSERMSHLIELLRQRFDLIIIDCPPLEPVSDARILTKFADGMVMVVRSGRTAFDSAERSLRSIEREKLVGVVLNDVRPLPFNTYYGRHYYYSSADAYPYVPFSSLEAEAESVVEPKLLMETNEDQ